MVTVLAMVNHTQPQLGWYCCTGADGGITCDVIYIEDLNAFVNSLLILLTRSDNILYHKWYNYAYKYMNIPMLLYNVSILNHLVYQGI